MSDNSSENAAILKRAIESAVYALEPILGVNEVKIYELADVVVKSITFEWNSDPYLQLYEKLFITQAALCRISQKCDDKGSEYWVEMTPVGAKLTNSVDTDSTNRQVSSSAARPNESFFLNPNNFFGITSDRVQALLSEFWTNFNYAENHDASLEVLGFTSSQKEPTWRDIQIAYRKKAAIHHPDKGGDERKFVELRAAYEYLKKRYAPHA